MNIAVVTIAYNSDQGISRLVQTATQSRHDVHIHLFLHSRHSPTMEACSRLARLPSVVYYDHGCNRGLSRSWNDGILNAYASGADIVLVVNDDVCFSPGDIDQLARKALDHRDRYIISCAGFHRRLNQWLPSHGYSCFVINPIAAERIGSFDENFFPCYCEDQDYAYRAKLAGLEEENCSSTRIWHGGSNTIYGDPALSRQNRVTQGKNMEYYRRKWGGPGGQERFTHPFDNPEFNYGITANRRHCPYGPPFDRTDHDIVNL